MQIGVIGTGNMGGMLAKAFAFAKDTEVYVYNRTASKAHDISNNHSNILVLPSAKDVARNSDVIFVCTKPCDVMAVLTEVGHILTKDQLLVATISSLPLEDVESLTAAGVAKVIPSIVQTERSGILLVTYGPSLSPAQQYKLQGLLSTISTPFVVEDHQIRIASDMTSCGPAFLSVLLVQWAEAAARSEKVNYHQAEHLLTTTLVGLANLLNSGMTLHDIISKVSVPGGVTEKGIACLRERGSEIFDQLHKATSSHSHGIHSHGNHSHVNHSIEDSVQGNLAKAVIR